MRNQLKYLASSLIASALVLGCAGEADDETSGPAQEISAESEPPAEGSSDAPHDVTFGDSDKALRDHYCCALKSNNVTIACGDIYATKVRAKTACAASAIGPLVTGHALRGNRCSAYDDC